jgi:hypothetical protein
MKHTLSRILGLLALSLALSAGAEPFRPAETSNIAVTGTAQSLTLPAPSVSLRQVVLTNVGTQTVFYRDDGTTATAANGMPLLANSQVVVSIKNNTTALSVIAATTGSTLYVTVGAGE